MLLTDVVTLTGAHVRLEPLHAGHADDLRAASAEFDERPWYTVVPAADAMDADIADRLARRDAGWMNPWAIRRLSDDRVVGETTFCNIDLPNRRVEVGYTWIAPSAQRSAVNAETKLLALGHAFDVCDVIAVALQTHWHNRQSRAAIERLGAKQDGVIRNHRIGNLGEIRDTVVYSIIPSEWAGVRAGLEARLRRSV